MIKKITHLADIHIRKELNRHHEYDLVFTNIVKDLKLRRPNRVVIVGDIFDDKLNTSNEMFLLAKKFIKNISMIIPKIIITRGNHDFNIKNRTRIDTIKAVVDMVDIDNIYYLNKSGFYIDENVIWVVFDHSDKINPWYELGKNNIDKSNLFDTIDNTSLPKEELTKSNISDFMSKYKVINLYHDPIINSVTPTGQVMESKSYRKLGDFKGDLLLLGDIHKEQIFYK